LARLVRVHSNPEPERGPEFHQISRALAFGGIFRRENAERVREARGLCSFHHFRQILGERVVR